ncbi:MAG: prepilin peptidase [Candidatus Saccharimonadales bacterium]
MIPGMFFIVGVLLGSFINALVWRLHEQGKRRSWSLDLRSKKGNAQSSSSVKSPSSKLQAPSSSKDLSILKGRSMCPQCHHVLAPRDLIPIFSWLTLRGRCRYCAKAISVQYPLIELLTGFLFTLLYSVWPMSFSGVHLVHFTYGLVYVVFFVALALYDMKWFLLPNKLVYPLTAVAASEVLVVALWSHTLVALWNPSAGAVLVFGLFWVLYQVSKGRWIGGGDVKLAIALGLIAGTPLRALLVVFFASLVGTVISLPLIVKGKNGMTQQVPFGPYLLAGCMIVLLFGARIVEWYQRILLQ